MKSIIMAICLALPLGGLMAGTVGAAGITGMEDATHRHGLNYEPGVLLNQTQEYLHQEALLRALEEEKAKVREGLQKPARETAPVIQKNEKFVFRGVRVTPSLVLPPGYVEKIADPYRNHEVGIKDLYDMVEKINHYYGSKGYVTCKAFLPRQKIVKGMVEIHLIEGKTGDVKVLGNRSTRNAYIIRRIELEKGRIDNVRDLDKSLVWFNGTNDVQLRIALKAGDKPGTTDYYVTAYEPPRDTITVSLDDYGAQNTGVWRKALTYTNRSLTRNRDQLFVTGMVSTGADSGAINYSTPISRDGTRLGLQYNANGIKLVNGALADSVRGHSSSYGVSLTKPLVVGKQNRVMASLEWNKQNSVMDILDKPWLNDSLNRWVGGLTFTHYNPSSVIYHHHSFTNGTWTNIDDQNKYYSKYQLEFIAQKVLKNRQAMTLKVNGQYSFNHFMPSSEQFYAGGVYTVRGYEENIINADNGYVMSLEYAIPDRPYSEWLLFIDHANAYGDNAYDTHVLTSIGFGYRLNLAKKVYMSLACGIPLQTECNDQEISKSRLHFALNSSF